MVAPHSPSDYTESEIRAVRDDLQEPALRGNSDENLHTPTCAPWRDYSDDDDIRTPTSSPWRDYSDDDDDIRTPTSSPRPDYPEENKGQRPNAPASPSNRNYFDKSDEDDIITPTYSPIREDIQADEPEEATNDRSAHRSRPVPLPTPPVLKPNTESLVRPLSAFGIDVANGTSHYERNLRINSPISRPRRQEHRASLGDPEFSEYRARNIYRTANQKQKPRKRVRFYKCKLCKIALTSSDQLTIHLNGGKHARREQTKKDEEANLYCSICDRKFIKSDDFKQHIDSVGHRNKWKRSRTVKRRAVSRNKN